MGILVYWMTEELQSKYNHKYDYQRAQCEDPEIMKRWFMLVEETIAKYCILEQDIYNFDETGFQMGLASTAKIITDSYHSTLRCHKNETTILLPIPTAQLFCQFNILYTTHLPQ